MNNPLTLLLMLVALALTGCQEQQQQSPQTANQMKNIEIWGRKMEESMKYLYRTSFDPNDPNSLTCRVEVLETEMESTLTHQHIEATPVKKKGWFGK